MDTKKRVLVVFLLFVSTVGLMADYAAHSETHRPYLSIGDVSDDYENHIGKHVYSWVRVDRVTDDGFVVGGNNGPITVISDADDVSPDDQVQVFGVVRPDRRIEAERVFVSPRLNRLYMFGVSIAGLFLTAVLFVRHWTMDIQHIALQPRRRND